MSQFLSKCDASVMGDAAGVLMSGGLVAFPTETIPTPVTVMNRLSVVPAPLAGIARATTPATAATVNMDVIVRSFVSFIGQVSRICCDGR